MKFLPSKYYPDVFSINYQKLKEKDISYLIFDLDNTLGLLSDNYLTPEVQKLLLKLSEAFIIIVVSNNFKKRVDVCLRGLDVYSISFAMKPSIQAFRKIQKKFNCKGENMVMIGDQIMTDICAANKFSICSILVDPISKQELKITSISRFVEKKVLAHYKKLGLFERGKYYE